MQPGFYVGSLLGIPVYLHSSWLPIVVIFTLLKGVSWLDRYPNWGVQFALCMGLISALALFMSVLLHELGHSLVARRQGIPVRSISLFLLGGIATLERESSTPIGALQIAIAGPIVNFFLFLSFAGLALLTNTLALPVSMGVILQNFAQFNLVLSLFNLIPSLPLDGGQVLKALVWKTTGDRLCGMRWAVQSGRLLGSFAISVGILGGITLPGLGAGLWMILIGWFILQNATAYDRLTALQTALLELQASQVMTQRFRVVDANLSIREFTDRYILCELSDTPFFGKQIPYYAAAKGRYRGKVQLDDFRLIPCEKWQVTTLEPVIKPLLAIPYVREATPLVQVVRQLEQEQLRVITVLSPADAIAGTIDRADILEAITNHLNWTISEEELQAVRRDGKYPPHLPIDTIAIAGDASDSGD